MKARREYREARLELQSRKAWGQSTSTTGNYINPLPFNMQNVDQDLLRAVFLLYENGFTCRKIAKYINREKSTIAAWIKAMVKVQNTPTNKLPGYYDPFQEKVTSLKLTPPGPFREKRQ